VDKAAFAVFDQKPSYGLFPLARVLIDGANADCPFMQPEVGDG
jgi:hypothetical protein